MIRKKLHFCLFALSLLLSLSGCLFGNGEPYGFGNKPDMDHGQNQMPVGTVPTYFYWIDPSYTCVKDGVSIPSFRSAMLIYQNHAYLLGDLCQFQNTEIRFSAVKVSASGKYASYDKGIYSWLPGVITAETVSQFPVVEAICFANYSYESAISDLTIERSQAVTPILTAQVYAMKNIVFESLVREDEATRRTYTQSDFSLSIETDGTALSAPGQLEVKLNGETVSQGLSCKMIISSTP